MTRNVAPPTLLSALPLRRTVNVNRGDQAFLPAALEILETPPSPVRMAMLVSVCLLFSTALVWGWFGKIDIHASATGKIQPTGQIKVLQSLVSGRVSGVHASNGMHVEAGETLLQLDLTEASSERNGIAAELASYRAEVARRSFEIDLARRAAQGFQEAEALSLTAQQVAIESLNISPRELGRWIMGLDSDVPDVMRDREYQVMQLGLTQLRSTLSGLFLQKKQKMAERERWMASISAESELVATLQARVAIYEQLHRSKFVARTSLLDATQSLQEETTRLASAKGQMQEAQAGIEVLDAEMLKAIDSFTSDDSQKLADASRHVDDLRHKLVEATARVEQLTLKAPISGTVQSFAITTLGQVVSPGQELMRIVPDDSELEVVAFLRNDDKGFVHDGQDAVIKVEAFPFVRYGVIPGTVVHVAKDSIPAADAQQVEGDPTRAAQQSQTPGGAQQTQNLVYPVTIRPAHSFIRADGSDQALSSGMTVTVDVRTGQRRLLEFLFSPMVEIGTSAMKER